MRKNLPVDEEIHISIVEHLNKIELQGGGRPSITSWIKSAIAEKITRELTEIEERKNV